MTTRTCCWIVAFEREENKHGRHDDYRRGRVGALGAGHNCRTSGFKQYER